MPIMFIDIKCKCSQIYVIVTFSECINLLLTIPNPANVNDGDDMLICE